MIRIDCLTDEERAACEAAGRAALDEALDRLTAAERAEVWHSIRCGYIQPTTGAAAQPPAPTPVVAQRG